MKSFRRDGVCSLVSASLIVVGYAFGEAIQNKPCWNCMTVGAGSNCRPGPGTEPVSTLEFNQCVTCVLGKCQSCTMAEISKYCRVRSVQS